MANSRSARKRIRANERKHVRNRAIRSSVRTKVGKARRALENARPLDLAVEMARRPRAAAFGRDRDQTPAG